ncbi:MAG: hypothetical protein ACREA0_24460, partial [bacterium]
MMINGTADQLLLWEGGIIAGDPERGTSVSVPDTVAFWVTHNGADVVPEIVNLPDSPEDDSNSTVSTETHANGLQGTEVMLYPIDGGGHTEPSPQERYAPVVEGQLGPQNHDIETVVEAWNFLKRHGLDGPVIPPSPATDGFLSPSVDAAATGGNGDGWEFDSERALVNGSGSAWNFNGNDDRHLYESYGISVPVGEDVTGIEVRLDWGVHNTMGTSQTCAELSWDGGTSWTAQQCDTALTSSENVSLLGGVTDTWGHSWSASELSDENFRVRLEATCSGGGCNTRDFYSDWVAVKVHTTGGGSPTSTGLLNPTADAADSGG